MSFVAVAIGGAAVVGAVASTVSGNRAASAAESGAASAADATVQSTQMQLEEIRRQFDYQQEILLPQIQSQYNAQGAFSDLLGISGGGTPAAGAPAAGAPAGETNYAEQMESLRQQLIAINRGVDTGPNADERYREIVAERDRIQTAMHQEEQSGPGAPNYPGAGATTFQRGANGEFIDPNLDPTRLADVNTLGDTVRSNLMAGTTADADPYRDYIAQNQIAAGSAGEDARVRRAEDVTMSGMRGDVSLGEMRSGASLMDERGNVLMAPGSLENDTVRGDIAGRSLADGAAGTGVYGESFEASPGYAFAREEMDRASDRVGSAGGNYGGRAVMEAQRRAKGLADQEYYNWAAGRTSDLQRQAGAEATDASRMDRAAYGYQDRVNQDIARGDQFAAADISRGDQFASQDIVRGDQFAAADISRGDTALSQYESQRIADVGRGDQAYQDYLRRREGDASRLDSAASQEDSLIAADQSRGDQAYYNYVRNLGMVAGFGGGPAAQAVNASQAAGAGSSAAYAQQGSQLSGIYSQLGSDQSNIAWQQGAGINNALVSGANSFATYRASA